MNIQLKKFNPASMGDDKVCVFIGKRGTGKSTLVTDILYHKKHLPAGVVMSATEEGNHWYQQFIPDLFIYGEYDKDIIERVIDRQRKMVNMKPPPGKKELTSRDIGAFILMDDCMYDRRFLKDACIRQCFMNGRHWKIFFMLTMQYCMDLSPRSSRQCGLCVHRARECDPEPRKVVQGVLRDLPKFRYVQSGDDGVHRKL
jgi:hypothetical protein